MVFPDKSMTNSELCEAVRGLPETTGIHFCFMEAVTATDSLHDIADWQRLCADYERLLAAAKDWTALRERMAKAGTPPHTDYWHQVVHDTENELQAAIEEAEK